MSRKMIRKSFVFDMISDEYWDLEECNEGFVQTLREKSGQQITQIHSNGNGYFDLYFEDDVVLYDIDSVHIKVVEESEF